MLGNLNGLFAGSSRPGTPLIAGQVESEKVLVRNLCPSAQTEVIFLRPLEMHEIANKNNDKTPNNNSTK